eukprot:g20499.t1
MAEVPSLPPLGAVGAPDTAEQPFLGDEEVDELRRMVDDLGTAGPEAAVAGEAPERRPRPSVPEHSNQRALHAPSPKSTEAMKKWKATFQLTSAIKKGATLRGMVQLSQLGKVRHEALQAVVPAAAAAPATSRLSVGEAPAAGANLRSPPKTAPGPALQKSGPGAELPPPIFGLTGKPGAGSAQRQSALQDLTGARQAQDGAENDGNFAATFPSLLARKMANILHKIKGQEGSAPFAALGRERPRRQSGDARRSDRGESFAVEAGASRGDPAYAFAREEEADQDLVFGDNNSKWKLLNKRIKETPPDSGQSSLGVLPKDAEVSPAPPPERPVPPEQPASVAKLASALVAHFGSLNRAYEHFDFDRKGKFTRAQFYAGCASEADLLTTDYGSQVERRLEERRKDRAERHLKKPGEEQLPPLPVEVHDVQAATEVLRAKKVFMMKLKSRSNQELPSVPVHAEDASTSGDDVEPMRNTGPAQFGAAAGALRRMQSGRGRALAEGCAAGRALGRARPARRAHNHLARRRRDPARDLAPDLAPRDERWGLWAKRSATAPRSPAWRNERRTGQTWTPKAIGLLLWCPQVVPSQRPPRHGTAKMTMTYSRRGV